MSSWCCLLDYSTFQITWGFRSRVSRIYKLTVPPCGPTKQYVCHIYSIVPFGITVYFSGISYVEHSALISNLCFRVRLNAAAWGSVPPPLTWMMMMLEEKDRPVRHPLQKVCHLLHLIRNAHLGKAVFQTLHQKGLFLLRFVGWLSIKMRGRPCCNVLPALAIR